VPVKGADWPAESKRSHNNKMVESDENYLILPTMHGYPTHVVGLFRAVVDDVAIRQGMLGAPLKGWGDAAEKKLIEVGITTVRDLIKKGVMLNRMLTLGGHCLFHHTMLLMLMESLAKMLLGRSQTQRS
jgi:hypothetical protein